MKTWKVTVTSHAIIDAENPFKAVELSAFAVHITDSIVVNQCDGGEPDQETTQEEAKKENRK